MSSGDLTLLINSYEGLPHLKKNKKIETLIYSIIEEYISSES